MGVMFEVRGRLSVGLADMKLRWDAEGRPCGRTVSVADRGRLRAKPGVIGLYLDVYGGDASRGRKSAVVGGDWPASMCWPQLTDGYASASILIGSSDPTAMGLPRSLTLPSLDPELMASSTTMACSSSPDGEMMDGSRKASNTGSFWKNSSESGSNGFQWVHLSYDKKGSGSVRTAGVECACEKSGRPIFFWM